MKKEGAKPITNVSVGVLACVDKKENGFSGRMFCQLLPEPVKFNDAVALIAEIEKIFDTFSFPHSYTTRRTFKEAGGGKAEKREEAVRYMTHEEMLENKGEKGTFVVSVRFRQNATWQGSIKWVEEKKEVNFRSALEMLTLMKEAIGEESGQEESVGWNK